MGHGKATPEIEAGWLETGSPDRFLLSISFSSRLFRRPSVVPNEKAAVASSGVKGLSATLSVLSGIARPYAAALFDLAKDTNAVEATEKELDAIADLIAGSDDFARFLKSPTISSDAKSEALDAVLAKASTSVLVGNTLRLVARNGRLFALPAIIAAYRALAAEARNEVAADVTSATTLSDAQQKELARVLKDKLGKDVTLNTVVDESLIGGLVVKVGSKMIDTSLKTKLSAMKIAMKGVS